MQRMYFIASALASLLLLAGCGKSKTGEFKTAKTGGKVIDEHNKAPHGGRVFHLHPENHEQLYEVLLKDEALSIYIIDHHKPNGPVPASQTELKITGLKIDGKDEEISLKGVDTKDGKASHFKAGGDAIPAGLKEPNQLAGGRFVVTIGEKKYETTLEARE